MILDVIDTNNKKVDTVEIKEELLGDRVKGYLLYEAVKMQMANKRQGTASTKTKGFVSGGGLKPWKQKGTGRARAGSIRSPLWRHGGTVFGPHPRDYSYDIPGTAKKEALKSALAWNIEENRLKILNEIPVDKPKTKIFSGILKKLNAPSSLIVVSDSSRNLKLAVRNLKGCKVLMAEGLNVYDLLKYKSIIITKSALKKIEERLCQC
ncbi:MAG: 50S ribosomal protein L4 [Deltaproteobacteria bacterium GWC2_42_11]|nr:MAG: 50S ribosomal protein L4 [Deltaproteobacteria bacterium GWC2_42_11]HBO85221.1 50S ribosomal protein L4 [Deltaproteobacteria bacterium]